MNSVLISCLLLAALFQLGTAQRMMMTPAQQVMSMRSILPPATFQQLQMVVKDPSLSEMAKRQRMASILDRLPPSIFQKMPMPAAVAKLPEPIQAKLYAIRDSPTMRYSERMQRARQVMESLSRGGNGAGFRHRS